MKEIKLSKAGKNRGKFVALVDDEDFEYLNPWRWAAIKQGKVYYAARTQTVPVRKSIRMHREIMNTPENMECDHVFHNGLDNRKFIEINGGLKCNLRNCTHKQNAQNTTGHGMSKYLGVALRNKGFRAYIKINGKKLHLGYFKIEEKAARAYDAKAKELFGEFANLNFKE